MTRAGPVPRPASGAVPLSVLVDFDGTVSETDVTDALLAGYATDPAWRARDRDYAEGRAGSRTLLAWDVTILAPEPARLLRTALAQQLDPTFVPFVAQVRALGGTVEVVSDGFGFYVAPLLERLGVGDLPIATAEMHLDEVPMRIAFPYGHPACFVCGTCKRQRVLAHREAGRFVILVGDGESDRYAAWHADLTFAKGGLARLCEEAGWPYRPWQRFADVAVALADGLGEGRIPGTLDALERLRSTQPSRGYVCGPEAWGPGREAPGPDRQARGGGAATAGPGEGGTLAADSLLR
ncbi:MAG: HAD-IB family phosphatase [Candidatus Limnocylindrales bacterium]